MTKRRNADLDEFLRGMEGLDYPASRSAILKRAADTGGLDTEVLRVLEQLSDRPYESQDDLMQSIRETYEWAPDDGEPQPAAPSALGVPEKDLVKQAADTRSGDPLPTGDS